jgi:hypothetical protein
LFFSADAEVNEKNQSSKEAQEKHHENAQEINQQHSQQERARQPAAEALQQQPGDPDRQPGRRCGILRSQ